MFQSRIRPPRRRPRFDPAIIGGALQRDARRLGEADIADRVYDGTLAGFESARRFFACLYIGVDPARETLFVAYLDRGAHCIHLSRHDGNAGDVAWPLRTILLEAAGCNAAGLIVAHNHPSGEPTPSANDRSATRRLASAAEAIDMTLVDHLLFAGEGCASFRRMGLL